MSKENTVKNNRKGFKIFKYIFLTLFLSVSGLTLGLVYGSIKESPIVNPKKILNELNLNSSILDTSGNLVERIHAEENRIIVPLNDTPENLRNAFIAIEDKRFYDHFGVDLQGLASAVVDNIKSRSITRGASTITQQLSRNVYLSHEQKLPRKIKEAYIAIKLERSLNKNQILEAYLNSIYLGQGAYGVQEASKIYFSKNVQDLTLAESALLAGITKNPSDLPPYLLVTPDQVDADDIVIEEMTILNERYIAIFNEKSIDRQHLILDTMKELGYIDDEQYNEAIDEDMILALKPGETDNANISSYFADYVKDEVLNDLVTRAGYTEEDAERVLATGGLNIYSTVDLRIQKEIEDIYNNFAKYVSSGRLSSWNSDGAGNIIVNKQNSEIVYYKKSNLLDSEENLVFNNSEYSVDSQGNIILTSPKLVLQNGYIDIKDYYTLDDSGNLVTHEVGSLSVKEGSFSISDGSLTLNSSFLSEKSDFYSIDSSNNLLIKSSYFLNDTNGLLQPQSASVIIEQSTGEIKALVGGRNFKGQKVLNRATTPRQPGSAMKPLGTFLPALDNGYTAATAIDDVPNFENGKMWPRNVDHKFRGLLSLRQAVENSVNVPAVKVLQSIGAETSLGYLEKMGIIKFDEPDSFITSEEDPTYNDVNPSSLALGGLSYGISPLDMAGGFSSIANEGVYIKPRAYVRIEDRNGNVIIDNAPSKTKVVSPQVAFIMTDILRTTVTDGIASRARISSGNSSIPVAGKTGTTSDISDIWFLGYTPYYTASVWIGNDSLSVKLRGNSGLTASLFSSIMKIAHKGLEPKSFPEPENITRRYICTVSGHLVGSACKGDPRGTTRSELFVKGTEPSKSCSIHVFMGNRTVIKRNPPYDASKHGGIYPEDYIFAPGSISDTDTSDKDKDEDEDKDKQEEEVITPPTDSGSNGNNQPTPPTEEENNNGSGEEEEKDPLTTDGVLTSHLSLLDLLSIFNIKI